ncbi:RNA-dependent RNA polymerase [Salix suchowensis]|nr:RNA-dependent RNA polymerase [Salix suchowensis]
MQFRDREEVSQQLVALGELEFRKGFLILSYLGGKNLEEVLSADQIRGFKDLSMRELESRMWILIGILGKNTSIIVMFNRMEVIGSRDLTSPSREMSCKGP